jgi:hypothetical protein
MAHRGDVTRLTQATRAYTPDVYEAVMNAGYDVQNSRFGENPVAPSCYRRQRRDPGGRGALRR